MDRQTEIYFIAPVKTKFRYGLGDDEGPQGLANQSPPGGGSCTYEKDA